MQALSFPFQNRTVLAAILRQGIRERTAGSALGFAFIIAYPILFLLIYYFVFVYILQVRVQNLSAQTYSIAIFCGLVPFLAFADALSVGTSSIVGNATLLRSAAFPYQLLPLRDVMVAHYAMGFGMLGLMVAAILDRGISPTILLVAPVYALQVVMITGIVWMFAICNVFFRDLSKMLSIMILFVMMISPIGYTEDMVPAGLRPWLALNPVSHFIFLYRDLLLDHVVNWSRLGLTAVFAFGMYLLGFFVITRLRPLVSDYV